MKKLGAILALTVAVLAISAGSVVGYPPGGAFLGLDPPTVAAGSTFSAIYNRCDVGETVNFEVVGATGSALCLQDCFRVSCFENARATLTAPAAPGTYTVTATGLNSGVTLSATLTVVAATPTTPAPTTPGGALPATGSDSVPIAQIGAGLAAAGTGIVVVAGIRRRRTPA